MMHKCATDNADFTFLPKNVTFSGASQRECVYINITDENIVEYDEIFFVELSTSDESISLSLSLGEVVIINDDSELLPVILLTNKLDPSFSQVQ